MIDSKSGGKRVLHGGLDLLSLWSFGTVLLAIFSIYTDALDLLLIIPVLATLTSTVALRYVALYHQFSKSMLRFVLLVPLAGTTAIMSVLTPRALLSAIKWTKFRQMDSTFPPDPTYHSFLPEWWLGIGLLAAGTGALLGLSRNRDIAAYPKPTEIREIARSPVYFGFGCSVFGLWAVLFVGVGVQRVIVIAPIFEEALKFGVALLIGATLFGRSTGGRVAVAAVAGLSFGVLEHATTYPTEPDAVYLYRSLFHTATTILSVSVYSHFESAHRVDLLWISPVLPIMFHFLYNTFAVLSSLILLLAFGSQSTVPTLVYGNLTVLCITVLICLSWWDHSSIKTLYMPIAHVLSDLA